MTSLVCSKCQRGCILKARPKDDELFGSPCDACRKVFCKTCSTMSTTEAHAVALSQKTILFFCKGCKQLFIDLPTLKKRNESLERTIAEFKRKEEYTRQRELDYEDKMEELVSQVKALTTETREKDSHIKRLKRHTQDFESDVTEIETNLTTKIREQNDCISGLNKEIIALRNKNAMLQEEIERNNGEMASLESRIRDLSSSNKNMLVTVDTLEKDNELYFKELKNLRQELALKDNGKNEPTNKVTTIEKATRDSSTQTMHHKKHQLLIVGGGTKQGYALIFKNFVGSRYDINCQWNEHMLFREAVDTCKVYSRNFGKNDHVVVFIGEQNAIKGKAVTKADLDCLLEACKATNIVIVGPSLKSGRPILNKFIHQQNTFLLSNLKPTVVPFIPLINLGHFDYGTKLELAKYIYFNFIKSTDSRNQRSTEESTVEQSEVPNSETTNGDFLE